MNDSLRWLLVLGCLCIVFLEAPQDLLQVFQDCSGAYPPEDSRAPIAASTRILPPSRLDAEDVGRTGDDGQSLAFTLFDGGAAPSGSRPPSTLTPENRRTEDARVHEPRDDRTEFRAEFAAGR
jgi:hypothetical protein